MGNFMNVSIVTCAWNRAIQLKNGVASILEQEHLPNEIIVVDDGSQDNGMTKEVCRLLAKMASDKGVDFKAIHLTDHPGARVSCYPRNVGLKHASHEIVLFTEPEMLHVGNTIQQMKEKIEADPDRLYVATQIWTMGYLVWESLTPEELADPDKIINHKYAQITDANNPVNTKAPNSDWGISGSNNCFAGCLFGTLKEHFMACRGFDESFFGYGWDDWDMIKRIELYLRIKKDNVRVHAPSSELCNDIVVVHQWHTKDYGFDVHQAATDNGKIASKRLDSGEYRANIGKKWGTLGRTKLNLGCGMKKKKGFVGIDIRPFEGVDHVLDVGKDKLPFEDNSIRYILADHLLEHLYPEQLFYCIEECWRVLKPTGVLHVRVPKAGTQAWFLDPDHKIHFTKDTFGFFLPPATGKDPRGYLKGFWHLNFIKQSNPEAIEVKMYPNKVGIKKYEYKSIDKVV